jgi:dipeptidase D
MLSQFEPARLWQYFEEITAIPRPSKKEEKIAEYIISFAIKQNLEHRKDPAGNILVRKPASAGYEDVRAVCLQSHLDMVCEKNSTSTHNFETDPIRLQIQDDWISAIGTTLGADNGIGIAAQLALLSDPDAKHGPLECLFTLDEETGLNGAKGLPADFFESRTLINLDSEDEGEIFIGCAGGMNTIAHLKFAMRPTPEGSSAFRIDVSGLQGGHSGTDIQKNRGNAIKILNQFLWESRNRFGARLSIFEGGNLRNAIPRESYAIAVIPDKYKEVFIEFFHDYTHHHSATYLIHEPDLKFALEPVALPEKILKKKIQEKLLNSIYVCPNGVIAWSTVMEDLVETSTNLASIRFETNNCITICTSQRSSIDTAKIQIANTVRSAFKLAGAKVEQTEGYPGWEPNPSSNILTMAVSAYTRLFGVNPAVKAIHAGLECGLFLEKYPYLDMISIGPTIQNPHSPSERISISSTMKFWLLLRRILQDLSKS